MNPRRKIFVTILVIVIIVGLGVRWKMERWERGEHEGVNRDLYQVVLLKNDQVFYGKLHDVYSRFPYLTDVYYLNAQARPVDALGRPVGDQRQKFTVIKRGVDEIHQPTDAFYIGKDSILYWENVGPNSLVAQGIKADKDVRAKAALDAMKKK